MMAMVKEFEEIQKNEVLARWAGITIESVGYTDYLDPDDGTFVSRRIHWPDFTSLDVLFKWCVPKLLYVSLICGKASQAVACGGEPITVHMATADTPGEALREAILSLIGEDDA